jgi:CheY-like chemotaxis protein
MLAVSSISPTKVAPANRDKPAKVPAAILAVTVDPQTRDFLVELAVSDGFGVRCVDDQVEAARVLELERPGLVLVDLDLPGREGLKLLRRLRQGPLRGIPCGAMTATNDPMLAVSCDAPVFYKPDLEGIEATVARLFWPDKTTSSG